MLARFKISGDSMEPALMDGQVVTSIKLPSRWLRVGHRVIVEVEPNFFIVKRIANIENKTHLTLQSDNRLTSSAFCGIPILKSLVAGSVIHPRLRRTTSLGV